MSECPSNFDSEQVVPVAGGSIEVCDGREAETQNKERQQATESKIKEDASNAFFGFSNKRKWTHRAPAVSECPSNFDSELVVPVAGGSIEDCDGREAETQNKKRQQATESKIKEDVSNAFFGLSKKK